MLSAAGFSLICGDLQGEWSEAQKHFRNLLGQGSRVRAPIVTINTIMAAYMKQGMFDQV